MGWETLDEAFAGPSYTATTATTTNTTRQPLFATVDPSFSHHPPRSQWPSPSPPDPDPTAKTSSSISLSCVTRETSQDDCSYSRFLAWAAVRRNSSRLMSSSDRLSCPLHRCRKQFKDHESMLKHIAACQYLATREYWCYEHMRVERFDDAKCKRCISHPSRRRKMLSMAKSFFSTLGHKSKRLPELDFDFDDNLMPAPPSYHESLSCDPPAKPELPSTEILEIDSTEVTGPQASVTEAPVPAIDPQALILPELDSTTIPMQSGMQWQPTPSYYPPTSNPFFTTAPAYEGLSATRPALQGPSQAPSQGVQQTRQAPRSKNLSPSSSVRSTTSTMSNVSNVSSLSSTSSIWSAPSTAWSGLETNLTSFSREEPLENISRQCPSDSLYVLPEIPELPADMPVIPELSTGDFTGIQDSLFSFDADLTSTDITYPDNFRLEEETIEPLVVQPVEAQGSATTQPTTQPEVKSLVSIAWETLQEHILSSLVKTQHVHNPLADQLRLSSSKTIATKGLGSLRRILDGEPPVSAFDTLCLVHVVYSFSLVVYNGDATRKSRELFAQSLLYATRFRPQDQISFRQVAKAIWQPNDMTDEQLSRLWKGQLNPPQRLPSTKGKENATRSNGSGNDNTDPLISTAQNFLDELELSAILSSPLDTVTSDLKAKHSENASIDNKLISPVTADGMNGRGLVDVLDAIIQRFHDVDGLIARLAHVNTRLSSGLVCSTRRFELEALEAGQNCIVPIKYFDDYVPLVRSLCDPIYELDASPGAPRRQEYYSLGIDLSEQLIADLIGESDAVEVDAGAISEDELDHDDLFASLTPPLTDDLVDMELDMEPLLGFGSDKNAAFQPKLDEPVHNPSSEPSKATAGSMQSPPESGVSSDNTTRSPTTPSSTPQTKSEADACCELCGYRPKGDPRWFHGSMAKHKKLQHSTDPPKIYQCPYPGCNSAYKNRPDNLRQHQLEKNHFVEGQDGTSRRPSKRRKMAS